MRSDVNWFGVLAHHALRAPERPMTVFEGRVTTYGEMEARAVALAGGLSERGVGQGDVVGLLSYNCPEFLQVVFAANYLGAIAMPINWRLAAPEVRYILEHSEARALVCDEALHELASAATDGHGDHRWSASASRRPGSDGWSSIAELEAGPAAAPRARDGSRRHPSPHVHVGDHRSAQGRHDLARQSLVEEPGPHHGVRLHLGRPGAGLRSALPRRSARSDDDVPHRGGRTTIIHRTFDAAAVVDELERSKVTAVWLAPAMVNAIMALPGVEKRDLSSVRVIINGGEKMPIPLIERIQRTFPSAWFADAYGLTETVSGDTFLDRDSIVTKLGSVGRPCLHLELEVWDDEGHPVPAGERGEIVMRGPKVFKGYWRDPEATAKAFAGGWFHTGDVGVRDEDGYLFIVDRLKDMIVSGGENIAGSEVERVLYDHEAVLEAAVVGRADERWGEVPVAFVVVRPGSTASADELIAHCSAQLAKFKVPKAVTFLDALPRNPSGKVLKRDLRVQGERPDRASRAPTRRTGPPLIGTGAPGRSTRPSGRRNEPRMPVPRVHPRRRAAPPGAPRAASDERSALRSARVRRPSAPAATSTTPCAQRAKVQRPCRNGRSEPLRRAAASSKWCALQSPETSAYRRAMPSSTSTAHEPRAWFRASSGKAWPGRGRALGRGRSRRARRCSTTARPRPSPSPSLVT